jgi:hypothetical protein
MSVAWHIISKNHAEWIPIYSSLFPLHKLTKRVEQSILSFTECIYSVLNAARGSVSALRAENSSTNAPIIGHDLAYADS